MYCLAQSDAHFSSPPDSQSEDSSVRRTDTVSISEHQAGITQGFTEHTLSLSGHISSDKLYAL